MPAAAVAQACHLPQRRLRRQQQQQQQEAVASTIGRRCVAAAAAAAVDVVPPSQLSDVDRQAWAEQVGARDRGCWQGTVIRVGRQAPATAPLGTPDVGMPADPLHPLYQRTAAGSRGWAFWRACCAFG